jgi:hypothetical protein
MGENYRVSRKIFRVTEVFSARAEACGYQCEIIFENYYKKQTLCGGLDCILMSPFFVLRIRLFNFFKSNRAAHTPGSEWGWVCPRAKTEDIFSCQ